MAVASAVTPNIAMRLPPTAATSIASAAVTTSIMALPTARARLARSGFRGNTLTLKVKFPDFVQKTRCTTVPEILTEKEGILPLARTLMEELDSGDRTFRLLGLSVSHPQEEQRQGIWEQLWLELEY